MTDADFWRSLIDCMNLWNSAERALKEAELLLGKAIAPSINELRYAGRWLIMALQAHYQQKDKIDSLTTTQDAPAYARLCCLQSKHDAIDSIIIFLHAKIEEINGMYSAKIISVYIDGYIDFLAEQEKIATFVATAREERHNRTEIYDSILTEHLPQVRNFLLSVKRAEASMRDDLQRERERMENEEARHRQVVDNLNSIIVDARQDVHKNKKLFWWSFAVNVVLALVSITIGVIALK